MAFRVACGISAALLSPFRTQSSFRHLTLQVQHARKSQGDGLFCQGKWGLSCTCFAGASIFILINYKMAHRWHPEHQALNSFRHLTLQVQHARKSQGDGFFCQGKWGLSCTCFAGASIFILINYKMAHRWHPEHQALNTEHILGRGINGLPGDGQR